MMVPALAGCVTTNLTPIDSIWDAGLPMADPGRNNVRYQPTPTVHTIAVGLGCWGPFRPSRVCRGAQPRPPMLPAVSFPLVCAVCLGWA